jgi:enoyl-CoA hydratase/carnithine racemase
LSNAVTVERRGQAAWLVLDEPERRNALSIELLDELAAALAAAAADDAVRAIVLTGRGTSFCAGADLRRPASPVQLAELMYAMEQCPKPVLSAVNGHAFGGGIGLIAAADIAIASETALLSFSEVRLGVIPAIIGIACVPKLGEHHARRLFLTGSRLSATEACAVGLLHRVVPAAELEAAVEAELAALALGAPGAQAEAKAFVARLTAPGRAEAYAWAAAKSAELFASEEATEGRAAFLEKRKPRWAVPATD